MVQVPGTWYTAQAGFSGFDDLFYNFQVLLLKRKGDRKKSNRCKLHVDSSSSRQVYLKKLEKIQEKIGLC